MNYSEIQDLCERRKITIYDVSRRIGMSYSGFKTSMETGKMSADKVAKLCKELSITPNYFFGWEKANPVTYVDSNVQNGAINVQNIQNTVDVLKDQLKIKDEQIANLLAIIREK